MEREACLLVVFVVRFRLKSSNSEGRGGVRRPHTRLVYYRIQSVLHFRSADGQMKPAGSVPLPRGTGPGRNADVCFPRQDRITWHSGIAEGPGGCAAIVVP